jgi:hypothetical protein
MASEYTPSLERIVLAYQKWAFLTDKDEAEAQVRRFIEAVREGERAEHLTFFDERCVYCDRNYLDADVCTVTDYGDRRLALARALAERDERVREEQREKDARIVEYGFGYFMSPSKIAKQIREGE